MNDGIYPTGRLSEPFAAMAKLIADNGNASFGGAVVVVPPGDGAVIKTLMLNEAGPRNEAAFWSLLKMQIEVVLADIEQRERQAAAGFGRR